MKNVFKNKKALTGIIAGMIILLICLCIGLKSCIDARHQSAAETGYKVCFEENGGSLIRDMRLPKGGVVPVESVNSVRLGYSLDGWYTSSDLTGAPWNFETAVAGDMTLYAKWTMEEYTVTIAEDERYTVKVDRNGEEITSGTKVTVNDVLDITTTYGEGYVASVPAATGENGRFILGKGKLRYIGEDVTVFASLTPRNDVPYTVRYVSEGDSPETLLTEKRTDGVYGGNCNVLSAGKSLYNNMLISNGRVYTPVDESKLADIALDGSTVVDFVCTKVDTSKFKFFVQAWPDGMNVKNEEGIVEIDGSEHSSEVFFRPGEYSGFARNWTMTGTVTKLTSYKRGFFAIGIKSSDGKVKWFEVRGNNYAVMNNHNDPDSYMVNSNYPLNFTFSQAACSYYYGETQNGGDVLNYKIIIEADTLKVYFWNNDSRYSEPVLGINVPLTDENFGGFAEDSYYQIGIYDRYEEKQATSKTLSNISISTSNRIMEETQYRVNFVTADGTLLNSIVKIDYGGKTVTEKADSKITANNRFYSLDGKSSATKTIAEDGSTVFEFVYKEYKSNGNFYIGEITDNAQVDFENRKLSFDESTDGYALFDATGEQSFAKKWEISGTVTKEDANKRGIFGVGVRSGDGSEKWYIVYTNTYAMADDSSIPGFPNPAKLSYADGKVAFVQAACSYFYAESQNGGNLLHYKATIENDVLKVWFWNNDSRYSTPELGLNIDLTDITYGGFAADSYYQLGVMDKYWDIHETGKTYSGIRVTASDLATQYEIRYTLADGTVLDSFLRTAEPGEEVSYTAQSRLEFDGRYYRLTDDDSKSATVLEDNSTVITFLFEEFWLSTYPIRYALADGTVLKETTGEAECGTSVTVTAEEKLELNGQHYKLVGAAEWTKTILENNGTVFQFTYEKYTLEPQFYIDSTTSNSTADPEAGTISYNGTSDAQTLFKANASETYATLWEMTGTVTKEDTGKRGVIGFGVRASDGTEKWYVIYTNTYAMANDSSVPGFPNPAKLSYADGKVAFVQAACSYFYAENQNGGNLLHFKVELANDNLKVWFWNDDSRYSTPTLGLNLDLTDATYGGFAAGSDYQLGLMDKYWDVQATAKTVTDLFVGGADEPTEYKVNCVLSDGTLLTTETRSVYANKSVTVEASESIAANNKMYSLTGAKKLTMVIADDGSSVFEFVYGTYVSNGNFYIDTITENASVNYADRTITFDGQSNGEVMFNATADISFARKWELTGTVTKADISKRGVPGFCIRSSDGTEKWYIIYTNTYAIADDSSIPGFPNPAKLSYADGKVAFVQAACSYFYAENQNGGNLLHYKIVVEDDNLKVWFWNDDNRYSTPTLGLNLDLTDDTYGGFAAGSNYQLGLLDKYWDAHVSAKTFSEIYVTASDIATQYTVEYVLSDGTVLKSDTLAASVGTEVTVAPNKKLAIGDKYYQPIDTSAVTKTVTADGKTVFSFIYVEYVPDDAFYVDSCSDTVTYDAVAGTVNIDGTATSSVFFKANAETACATTWEMTGTISKTDAKKGYLSFAVRASDGTEKWFALSGSNYFLCTSADWKSQTRLTVTDGVVMTNDAVVSYFNADNTSPLHFRLVIENDTLKAYFWNGGAGCTEADLAWNLPLTDATYGGFAAGSSYQLGIGDRYIKAQATEKTVTNLTVVAKNEP